MERLRNGTVPRVTPPKDAALAGPAVATSGHLPARSPGLIALLPAIVAAALYVPALQHGFVWEDATIVASRGRELAQGFHPAATALFRLEWLAGIGSPAFFHFTSLVLHALATWLFFGLIRGAGASTGIAMGASLLFAAHPIHTEAVAYATGRPDLLATACALGALALARSAPVCAPGGCRSWRVWPAYALLAVAVLADEVALVTPLLLVGLDRWGSPRVPTRGRTTVYWGFAAVALAGLLARIGAKQLRMSETHELLAPGAGVWGVLLAAYEYLRVLVVPFPLDAMRSLTSAEASSTALRILAVAAIAAVALFVAWRRRDPLARTGALLLALPLLPALPIQPFQGAYVEERAAYFPSVGFCFLVASLYAAIGGRARATRIAALALAIVVAGAAAAVTVARVPVWSSNVALLTDAVRHDPNDPASHLALADQFVADRRYEAALASVNRAIAIDSTNAEAHHKRTILLSGLGQVPEAEAAARRAVALRPEVDIYWANLGDLLTRQGRVREANDATRRAVTLDPKNAENWYNYGVSLAASDSLPQAIAAYQRTIEINPKHFQAVNNLGAVLAATGRLEEARDAYQKAVDIQPGSVQSRMNLALAFIHLGDAPAAARERAIIERQDRDAAAQLVRIIKQIEASKAPPIQRP